MMPGVGYIGGKLSIVGGYSWPGGVDTIEQWDEDTEEWTKTDLKIRYARSELLITATRLMALV